MDEPPDVEPLLENWSRWARSGDAGPAGLCCLSAESNYRSPQVWHQEEPRTYVNARLALQVEAAWRSLPPLSRTALRAWYILLAEIEDDERRRRLAARAIERPEDAWEDCLWTARRLITRRLEEDIDNGLKN